MLLFMRAHSLRQRQVPVPSGLDLDAVINKESERKDADDDDYPLNLGGDDEGGSRECPLPAGPRLASRCWLIG